MARDITPVRSPATGAVFPQVRASFDRFFLSAGIEALGTMMEADVTAACRPRSRCGAAGTINVSTRRFGRRGREQRLTLLYR